jgi:hypothetical protein
MVRSQVPYETNTEKNIPGSLLLDQRDQFALAGHNIEISIGAENDAIVAILGKILTLSDKQWMPPAPLVDPPASSSSRALRMRSFSVPGRQQHQTDERKPRSPGRWPSDSPPLGGCAGGEEAYSSPMEPDTSTRRRVALGRSDAGSSTLQSNSHQLMLFIPRSTAHLNVEGEWFYCLRLGYSCGKC